MDTAIKFKDHITTVLNEIKKIIEQFQAYWFKRGAKKTMEYLFQIQGMIWQCEFDMQQSAWKNKPSTFNPVFVKNIGGIAACDISRFLLPRRKKTREQTETEQKKYDELKESRKSLEKHIQCVKNIKETIDKIFE